MTAAEYRGPVIVLEPKWMYRQYKGQAFPNEPTDKDEIAKLRKFIMKGGIPEIDENIRVPFHKLATRREGDDVTIVAWGRAVWTALDAAQELKKRESKLKSWICELLYHQTSKVFVILFENGSLDCCG